MPQQVEMRSSQISDNNNKQHISNQNEATQHQQQQQQQQQQRHKRSRQQQQQQQHIYENLPVSTTSQQLRKYFRREAIYENVCRGCGYGVFAAQGRYCHFCQCIVSGSVVAALQQSSNSNNSGDGEFNIYENICELCRGIYSDNEQCDCKATTTATPTLNDTPQLQETATATPTATATATPAAKTGKSRTLLGYSKSSAATLTRLFGSLKQLNRSSSLQRRLFQQKGSNGTNTKGGGAAGGGGGSLEIIHNVDEVFRTQETFDMQRICELKQQQQQLQCSRSRSEQHIYGRLRAEREPEQQKELQKELELELQKELKTELRKELQTELEPESQNELEPELEPAKETETETKKAHKKPRISALRLLQPTASPTAAATAPPALYLNDSVCQWMQSLRRELHCYEDVLGGVGCQQPKSVPPAYERERDRERDRELEPELVTLRRSEQAAATTTTTAQSTQLRLVNDFKRKLLAKREQQQQQQLEIQLDLPQWDARRRCGINERHDAAFVTEFLSGLAADTAAQSTSLELKVTAAQSPHSTTPLSTTLLLACHVSLEQLWLSAALAASLNRSVICFFGYDKCLAAFLHGRQRRQRLRLRSSEQFNIERWLRHCYRQLNESTSTTTSTDTNTTTIAHGRNNNNNNNRSSSEQSERESATAQRRRQRQRQRQRRLLGPSSMEPAAVVPATPASDDVALASRVDSDNEQSESENVNVNESVRESETKARSKCGSSSSDRDSVEVDSALMAAPKQSGDAERRASCDDSENNNNNANSSSSNNNINIEQQQQQLQQQTQKCAVIKVRRPAPQVPQRNPSTALSKPRTENNNNNETIMEKKVEEKVKAEMEAKAKVEQEEEDEESIYQTIWQYKTLEPGNNSTVDDDDDDDEDFEIITATETVSDDDADVDGDRDEADAEAEAEAETLALQAAAAFAAGARHKLTKQATTTTTTTTMATTTTASASPATSPLPSPTASMDHGAWETDDEFMFEKASERQQQQQQQQQSEEATAATGQAGDETLSVGSTVTNSTATLGSISSAGGSSIDSSNSSGSREQSENATNATLLTHPMLRNICIFYSLTEPQKYSAIFYEYQRSQIHQRFMTRIRRPAPPLPTSTSKSTTTIGIPPSNDDSGCSCEADTDDLPETIPRPLKEDWALAVLAASASSKRGVAPRAGRKLRVRSSGRLLIPTSVLAWREQLQDVNCCEDEEDMIVPVSDIRRAQQIEEDNEVQQTQQISKSQRFKSASIGNLVDLPGEDDKKSIKNRMRMKFAPSNVFRIRGDKKSRSRRSQVNSLCLDEQSKYPLFGARLNALELNMSDHPYVPRFVVDVCAHIERPDAIEQDGLYRASGNKLLVDELKLKLTHLYDPRWLQTDDIHTLTSLHKQFFRELPAPLITQEAYERLGRLTDEAAIERMRLAFDEMPEPNRSTLRFLIKHLTNVAAASGSNRMPASNLAIVWGPCLLAANVINFDIGRMNMLAKMLIENYERIFRPDNERLVC
ncbi:uncharacterized protein LOC117563784 isoform X1 [Drosophila albomicans]|uniref:Uncharacterized protein LOC117563784 isoform X1 n=1 Tax=Drosophila albomicans TaxID=7291 RepID=A0A6P8XG53_DROAB|nr:uncharacterized protein LOC117563784 isoform X1 [Drosophila albomicans]